MRSARESARLRTRTRKIGNFIAFIAQILQAVTKPNKLLVNVFLNLLFWRSLELFVASPLAEPAIFFNGELIVGNVVGGAALDKIEAVLNIAEVLAGDAVEEVKLIFAAKVPGQKIGEFFVHAARRTPAQIF